MHGLFGAFFNFYDSRSSDPYRREREGGCGCGVMDDDPIMISLTVIDQPRAQANLADSADFPA